LPAVFETALELLGFDTKIDNVRVTPNEWMERLNVNNGRSVPFPAINIDRAGLAQRDGDNARCRMCAKEHRVFLEFHESSTDCADLHRLKARPEILQRARRLPGSRRQPERVALQRHTASLRHE